MTLQQLRLLRYLSTRLPEFSGGLNLRDAATELGLNESPDLLNVTLDERGGLTKRLGYVRWNASAAANPVTYGYSSSVATRILWYSAADGKLYSDPGTGVLTLRHTFTPGPLGLVDFAGKVYANTLADGLFASADGISWAAVTATSGAVPKGSILASWQNKLWVADPTSNELFFSAPGDAQKWDSADDAGSNHVREGNDFGIVALYGGAGADSQTKPSLIVGKRSGGAGSLHRVIDAATGDYVTLDQTIGPAGPMAITSLYGRVYVVSTSGIYATDGISPLQPIGQKIEPLFSPALLDYTKANGFCAGADGAKLYFSLTQLGQAHNNLVLEFYPLFGAFTRRDDAAACYVTYRATSSILLAASPAVTGRIYRLNTGGSDDGQPITSRFLTRVLEPLGGYENRVQRVKTKGRAVALNMQLLPDFAASADQFTLEMGQGGGFVWDTGVWDVGAWGEGDFPEGDTDVWPRMYCRACQVRFDETSTLTSSVIVDGISETVGAWALYEVELKNAWIGLT